MRSLGDVRQQYTSYTAKASETVRNSAIAGLAGAWLFSGASDGELDKLATSPDGLLWAGAFFAATLGFDIAHYFSGGLAMGFRTKFAEHADRKAGRKSDETRMITISPWLARIPRTFYVLKVVCLIVGYVFLAAVLFNAATDDQEAKPTTCVQQTCAK